MTEIISFLQKFIPALERYLLSNDKQAYLSSIGDTPKKIIELLLKSQYSAQLQKQLIEIGIPYDFCRNFQVFKLIDAFQKAEEPSEALLEDLKKIFPMSFNYQRPLDPIENDKVGDIQSRQSIQNCKLTIQENISKCIEKKLRDSNNSLDEVNQYALLSVDQKYWENLKADIKQRLLQKTQILRHFNQEFLVKLILQIRKQKKKKQPSFCLSSYYLNHLTKGMLNKIYQRQKDVINQSQFFVAWLKANHGQHLKPILNLKAAVSESISQKQEKRQALKQLIKTIQGLDSHYSKILKQLITFQILLTDLALQNPRKKQFIEFIGTIKVTNCYLNNQYNQKIIKKYGNNQSFNKYFEGFIFNQNGWDQNTLIQAYVKCLFDNQQNPNQLLELLSPFIDKKLLDKTCLLAKLARGQKIEQIQGIIDKNELRKLQEKKEITILAKNKRNFKVNDDVVLLLKIKNVKSIKVKIYEIDLQKKNTTATVYSDFGEENLSYLEPISCFVKEVENSNPFKETYYDMPIMEIGKKAGAFIVDLEGDGIMSRAAIRKGAMACQTRTTSAGVQLKFFDEDGQIVQDMLLWIQGKKVSIQKSYTIPFGINQKTFKIIAVKDCNSQIFTVNVPREQYNFKARFFYTHQSFIVGNKAKIVISPILTTDNRPVSLKLIKNSKIQILLIDNHDVKSMINYDNIEWSSKQDFVLQFPIQAYTKTIKLSISGQIDGYSGNTININSSHDILIDLMQSCTDYVDIYLRKNKGQYEAMVLGLNGQIVPSCQAFLSYKYRGVRSQEEKQLKTDEHGKLYLGRLSTIQQLTIEARGIKRQWSINLGGISRNASEICFKNNLTFKEGENISLPLPGNIELKDIAFTRFQEGIPIGCECKSELKIHNMRIQYQNAKQGRYLLQILSMGQKVNIKVIKGRYWGSKLYDFETEKLYDIHHNANSSMGIGNIKTERGQNCTQCKVELNIPKEHTQKIKLHAFAYNFIQPEIPNLSFTKPGGNYQEDIVSEGYCFPKSEFFSNKLLSDEQCYVKNRVQSEKFIGNSLQKPRILLKRIDVQGTTSVQEQLSKQRDFVRQEAQFYRGRPKNAQYFCKSAESKDSFGHRMRCCSRQRTGVNNFNSHNNFLSLSCIVKTNLKGNIISLSIPKGYENVKLIVVGDNSVVQKQFNLCDTQASSEIHKKDLRHIGLQQNKQKSGWTMSRQCYPIFKGETLKINRNSQWTTVSLGNILNFASIKRAKVDDWVSNWKNYGKQKKLKIYDKQYCHQLNVYLKENDPQFFNQVIKPFIQNKINKTFVDLYLLQDSRCEEWANIPKLRQLNTFEAILLVKHLLKAGNKKQAESIARSLQLAQRSNKISSASFNHEFDTVINAKEGEKKPNAQLFERKKKKNNKRSSQEQDVGNFDEGFTCAMAQNQCFEMQLACQEINEDEQISMRKQYQKAFQPMQATKEYTQITYSKIKNPKDSINLVKPALFWAKLAVHLIENPDKDFLTEAFLYLNQKLEFTLASCFIPNNSNAEFQLTSEGQNFVIQAKNSFLVFVKEVKQIPFQNKFGVMINQRFFDPMDRKIYEEDGTELDKQVEQFLVRQVYSAQTVVTNTSGTNLDLQVLLDIPEGSIPLQSHEYTQIINASVNAYSTKSFERKFYFPRDGIYNFYQANACRGKTIIAKGSKQKELTVRKLKTIHNKQNLSDILRSGNQQHILDYISTKNIFDENIFIADVIYWMLGEKEFYLKVIEILRARKYYDSVIWKFAFLHKDKRTIEEYLQREELHKFQFEVPVLEYFPYYSSRTHQFQNQGKSNIRNVQLKNTYYNFIIAVLVRNLFQDPKQTGKVKLTMIYYLLLQDRITQANQIMQSLSEQNRSSYQVQIDYLQCYIDICLGYPEFKKARQVAVKYVSYPIQSWQKLFAEVVKILNQYDSDQKFEQRTRVQYQTKVLRNENQLKISIPPQTQVRVSYHSINLELFFSLFPYSTFNFNEPIIPKETLILLSGQARQQKVARPEKYKDVFVVIQEINHQKVCKKVESFHWANPELKVKVIEKQGTIKVFYKGKKLSGCYCKVYSEGSSGQKFYRDGYTDITGTFKYAMANLQGIRNFAILVITENGGSIVKVGMPDMHGVLLN